MGPSALASIHAAGHEMLRVSAWLMILGVLFVPAERLFADRRQPVLRRQIGLDLAYYFLNSIVTVAVISSVLAVLGVAIYRAEPSSFHALTAEMPLWARIVATMTVGELGFYWAHRWLHEVPLLWRFHAIHHSAVQIDWLTNTRAHPLDVLFPRLCGYSLIYACGLAQVGASPAGAIDLALGLLHPCQREVALRLAGMDRRYPGVPSVAPRGGRAPGHELRSPAAGLRLPVRNALPARARAAPALRLRHAAARRLGRPVGQPVRCQGLIRRPFPAEHS
jgi:hypothetical protein